MSFSTPVKVSFTFCFSISPAPVGGHIITPSYLSNAKHSIQLYIIYKREKKKKLFSRQWSRQNNKLNNPPITNSGLQGKPGEASRVCCHLFRAVSGDPRDTQLSQYYRGTQQRHNSTERSHPSVSAASSTDQSVYKAWMEVCLSSL